MTDRSIVGFALRRNGTCLVSEESCGATAGPFYACCPSGSRCANPYNEVCCSSSENCTSSAVEHPTCADPSWDLYNNGGVDSALFCCLNSTFGYGVRLDSNGCANPDYRLPPSETQLVKQPQNTASSTSLSTSTSATMSPTPAPSPSPTGHSSNGATIGGAVGGAVGGILLILILIAFFWRRQRQQRLQREHEKPSENTTAENLYTIGRRQKQAGRVYEVGGQGVTELPSSGSAHYSLGAKSWRPLQEGFPESRAVRPAEME